MKNLFAFVIRHNFIFLFLFLQLLSVWLMVRHKGYQGSRVLNSSNQTVASVYQTASNTKEYFSLKVENERLAKENAVLRNFLRSSYSMFPLKEYTVRDTVYKEHFNYVTAKVVNASVNKRRNYFTLNAGSSHGIGQDMGVMSSDGIIGIVTDVTANFSSVMSLLHKDLRVNCQLKRDGSYGPLVWDGHDYRHCLLLDIPTHARIKPGDTVITSELSGIFPEGLTVGTVVSFERRRNESFYTARIRLSADMKKVNHVYVIKNRLKGERDSLEAKAQVQIDD